MADENGEGGLIRRYLLGQISEDERQQLEERIMTDTELFNQVLLAEDDIVEEYVRGGLSESERAGFEASFLSTAEGRKQVSFAEALSKYVSTASTEETRVVGDEPKPLGKVHRPVWWSRPSVVPYLKMAAAAVVVLAIGLGAWYSYLYFRQSEASKGMLALSDAFRNQRPTEARITGLNYAEPPPTTRGPERDKFDYVALDRARALIQLEAKENPSAKSYHDLGRLYLAERDFEKALEQLEKAQKLDEKNAQLHSDCGAALIEIAAALLSKGEAGKSLEALARSLEQSNRAIELDSSLLEAVFNRALCYEEMSLPRLAEQDWRTYLEKDPNSRWADEARRRLKELEDRNNRVSQTNEQTYQSFLSAYEASDPSLAWEAFTRSRGRAGNFIVEKLIDDYLELSSKSRNREAKGRLRMIAYLGGLEFQNVGDRFTIDLVQVYKTAGAKEQSLLKEARDLVKSGQVQIAESDFKSAFDTFSQAKAAFEQVGDKCESISADYWLAVCYSQEIDPQQCESRFQQLAADSEKDNYKWLVVRALNGLAHRNEALNEHSMVIRYSDRALELAEQTQDTYGSVLALLYLIRTYSYLGNDQEALNHLQRLLRLAGDKSLEPIQICVCYARTAWTLYLEGLETASLDFQKLALEHALDLKEITMICTSYVNLGMINAKLNNSHEALSNVRRAFEMAKAHSDERPGLLMMAYSALHLGNLLRRTGDLNGAIPAFHQSAAIYSELNYPGFVHEAHKGLLYCLIDSGDIASAKEELGKAIGYYEDHRSKIQEQDNRNTFFDLEQDIYDVAIDFEYSRMHSAQTAFEYSERSRGRSLLDLIHRSDPVGEEDEESRKKTVAQPLSVAEIQEGLPEQVQVLHYAVLEDKLLVWLLARTRFKDFERPIALKELSERIEEYSALVRRRESNPEDLSRLAKELHGLMIGPAEPYLDKNKQLFIVADKFLNYVPFQSLISPTTGHYLLEDYKLALSPSSSVLLACTEMGRKKEKAKQETALSVGVTRFDHSEYGKLPDLLSADREATEIAECYKRSSCLTGERVTKREILRKMEKANIIHLASHFIPSDSSPLRSRLLLVSDPGRPRKDGIPDSVLEASEVCKINLSDAKLVVLSACYTGIERYYRGEGAIGIAHSFIAARVPMVVASLWAIDSESTAQLMINFHRNRRLHRYRNHGEGSSAEALRDAQLAILTAADARYSHPYYWASFNLIGGYAAY